MGDDSKTDVNVKSEGTLVQEGDKIYWFPGTHQFKGVVVPKGHAVDLVEGIVGRKLSDDEFGLLFSVPVNGSKSVTIISTLVSDPSEPNYLKSIKSEVIGYIVSTRENRARHNYGDIIAKTAFYDTDGKQQGTPEYTYKDEPGLVSPWLDPIDLIGIGGAVVDLAKFTAKAFSRSSPKVIARSAPKALPKAVRQVTADEVELGIRPPTAAEFRKQIASFTRGEEAAGGRASGRISALDKGRGARPFYAKDPKAPGKGPPGSAANRGYLDRSGRFHSQHGAGFPTVKDLGNYSADELQLLRQELQESVRARIQQNIRHGLKPSEAERQAAEQALIRAIDKRLR